MICFRFIFTGLMALGLVFPPPGTAGSLRELFKQVDRSVVVVRTVEKQLSRDKSKGLVSARGLGSGVLIAPEGLVMTASHVVHVADAVAVELWDGQLIPARVVGSEPTADLALLQLEQVPENLQPAPLGDSSQVEIGDEVFVVGAPYGVGRSLTAGHISAIRVQEDIPEELTPLRLFQTDAAINRGNSGGPMFNMQGEVIGIVSSILSQSGGSEGLGFAVTSNVARKVLLEEKTFWAGVTTVLLRGEFAKVFNLPQPAGLLVQQVAQNSPADHIGLRPGETLARVGEREFLVGGDIILAMLGRQVTDKPEFLMDVQKAMKEIKAHDRIVLKVLRDGTVVDLSLTVLR